MVSLVVTMETWLSGQVLVIDDVIDQVIDNVFTCRMIPV